MSDNYGITGNVRATNLTVDGRAAEQMREQIRREAVEDICRWLEDPNWAPYNMLATGRDFADEIRRKFKGVG